MPPTKSRKILDEVRDVMRHGRNNPDRGKTDVWKRLTDIRDDPFTRAKY